MNSSQCQLLRYQIGVTKYKRRKEVGVAGLESGDSTAILCAPKKLRKASEKCGTPTQGNFADRILTFQNGVLGVKNPGTFKGGEFLVSD